MRLPILSRLALSETWRTKHKRYSTKALGVGVVLTTAWIAVPPDLKSALPDWLPRYVAFGIFGFGLIGAYLAQPGLAGNPVPADDAKGGCDAADHS